MYLNDKCKDNFPYDESFIKHEKDHEGMLEARIEHFLQDFKCK